MITRARYALHSGDLKIPNTYDIGDLSVGLLRRLLQQADVSGEEWLGA